MGDLVGLEIKQLPFEYTVQDTDKSLLATVRQSPDYKEFKVCLTGNVIQFPLKDIVKGLGIEPSNGGDGIYVTANDGLIYDLNEIVNRLWGDKI